VPPAPRPRVSGSKPKPRPKKMDWNCSLCKNMVCLDEGFNLKEYIKDKKLPSYCPLVSPVFSSRRARDMIIKYNAAIADRRADMEEIKARLKLLNQDISAMLVERNRQLKEYYRKHTVTQVTEKRKSTRKITPDKIPRFTIRVEIEE